MILEDTTLYIPCFNGHQTLPLVLHAVAAMAARPARLVVVDDGSSPPIDAPPVLPAPEAGAPGSAPLPVEIVRHAANSGLAAARNTALSLCRTPLLAALDADAVPDPHWLSILHGALRRSGAAGCGGRMVEGVRETLGDQWRAAHMSQNWGEADTDAPRFLYGCNTLFSAAALRDAGGYDARLRTNYEDMEMSNRLRARGARLVYTASAICRHLRGDTAATVLPSYWAWHHAKALLAGEFDSPEPVIRRVASVAFGLFAHRYMLDTSLGRASLAALDILLPWVFCAKDLAMLRTRSGLAVPDLAGAAALAALPPEPRAYLEASFPRPAAPGRGACAWGGEYLAAIGRAVEATGWLRAATGGDVDWAPLRSELAGAFGRPGAVRP